MSHPKWVFIIPYRDREENRHFFMKYMEYVLEDVPSSEYEIYFAHQCDDRPFNRGAMRNIGFRAVKEKYPRTYPSITFVFNDVDTVPYKKGLIDYETTMGTVKHFYGYTHTLGGIVAIKGADFERINGYPNLWAWGFEDNALQVRAQKAGYVIDRSQFFKIRDPRILHLMEGITRDVHLGEKHRAIQSVENGNDGITKIVQLNYDFEPFRISSTGIAATMIQISEFSCGFSPPDPSTYETFDITGGNNNPWNHKTNKNEPREEGRSITTQNRFSLQFMDKVKTGLKHQRKLV